MKTLRNSSIIFKENLALKAIKSALIEGSTKLANRLIASAINSNTVTLDEVDEVKVEADLISSAKIKRIGYNLH